MPNDDVETYRDLLKAGFSEEDAAVLVDWQICRRCLCKRLGREPTAEEILQAWRRM
jgi:hypothetical protein